MLRRNLGQQVGSVRRAFRRHLEAVADPYGLTATQFQVLRRLWEQDGQPVQQLAKVSFLDGATMTGVLDRLEGKGFIRRARHENDRRSVQIFLTPEGRALQQPLRHALDHVQRIAAQGISPEELDQMMRLLAHVEANLDAAPAGQDEEASE